MAAKTGEMILQTAIWKNYYPNVEGGVRVTVQGGNVNDEPDPVTFGTCRVQCPAGYFEDLSDDGSKFESQADDKAVLTFKSQFRSLVAGPRPATCVVTIDDKNNAGRIVITDDLTGEALLDTGIVSEPLASKLYVTQKFGLSRVEPSA